MKEFINVADLIDPSDPQGRSYREINREEQHKYSVGDLVEIANGVRLFIVALKRDCDETPLYSLGAELTIYENPFLNRHHHGFAEESLKLIIKANNNQKRKP